MGITTHILDGQERANRARDCIGLSYGNPATRAAYLAHQYPGDTPPDAASMGSAQSGCLLHLRGLLAAEDMDDDVTLRGKVVDALTGPYAASIGLVEGLLQSWCQQRGGGLRHYADEAMPELAPGELVIIGRGLGTHGLCVLEQSDEIVTSSDGGQTDPKNGFKPTAIAERVRRLQRIGGVWHLGDRPMVWGWR